MRQKCFCINDKRCHLIIIIIEIPYITLILSYSINYKFYIKANIFASLQKSNNVKLYYMP